jgi:hypothetical protein
MRRKLEKNPTAFDKEIADILSVKREQIFWTKNQQNDLHLALKIYGKNARKVYES